MYANNFLFTSTHKFVNSGTCALENKDVGENYIPQSVRAHIFVNLET
jgi:hypothetical protein